MDKEIFMTFREKTLLKVRYMLIFLLLIAGILFFADRYGMQYQDWEIYNTIDRKSTRLNSSHMA